MKEVAFSTGEMQEHLSSVDSCRHCSMIRNRIKACSHSETDSFWEIKQASPFLL